MKSPIALLCSLLNDFSRLHPGVKGLERDLTSLEQRFENEGYGFLSVALPSLDDAFVQGISVGKFTCPPGFKKVRSGAIPRVFSGMLCEIFESKSGLLKENPDIGLIKSIHMLLQLFKKTQMSQSNEEILHKKAVYEFYQCDETARQVIIPDRHDHLIGRVCSLVLNNLNYKDVENVKFRHGPGSVAEGLSSNQKWRELDAHMFEDVGDPGWTPATFDYYNVGRDLSSRVRSDAVRSNKRAGDKYSEGTSGSIQDSSGNRSPRLAIARLISVLKNSTSRRTITIEPMLNQYLQQGLRTMLLDSISKCVVLRNSIALSHQEYNQKLALEGSLYDNWATIDLKSASDRMSLTLVRSVFRHHPNFLGMMMDCRSPFVSCGEEPQLTLGKFAGMGNALTFPVQSICFTVIGIAAILDIQGKSPDARNVKRASRHIRVYGDDIIVSTGYAHQVVNWLQMVGLQVNQKKSFLIGNFKESCGVEAYKGVEITPLHIKHRPDQVSESPSVLAGFVSLSNHMWMECLYEASTCLRNHVEEFLGYTLPLVSRNSGSLGWHCRQDTSTVHKFCRNTHKFLVRTIALAPVKRRDRLDGYAALLKCLSLANESKMKGLIPSFFDLRLELEKGHLDSTAIRHKSRIVQRWVPAYVS